MSPALLRSIPHASRPGEVEQMSIKELKTLVAVSDFGSISAAAERVFLSVPAAAAQIAKLESEFKTELLNRARKPAKLTAHW
jgi:DNA-binding transcriptional LysR family regulator